MARASFISFLFIPSLLLPRLSLSPLYLCGFVSDKRRGNGKKRWGEVTASGKDKDREAALSLPYHSLPCLLTANPPISHQARK